MQDQEVGHCAASASQNGRHVKRQATLNSTQETAMITTSNLTLSFARQILDIANGGLSNGDRE
jgi:hypothetical protein